MIHLFDIEGTIAPVDYVHQTMFPYAAGHLDSFLQESPLSDQMFDLLAQEWKNDEISGAYSLPPQNSHEAVTAYLQFLIKSDRKSTVLKDLQGKIWKNGFESGALVSVIYPDTVDYFRYLSGTQQTIMIYSSGSIQAQKLYLKYSDQGDLSAYISGNFDTTTGPKKEKESYQKILKATGQTSAVFYTDIEEEATAAASAGFQIYILKRPGNKPVETKFQILPDFNGLR